MFLSQDRGLSVKPNSLPAPNRDIIDLETRLARYSNRQVGQHAWAADDQAGERDITVVNADVA